MIGKHIKRLLEMDLDSGSLEDYISLKGRQYQRMDTGRPEKFVRTIDPACLCPENGVILDPKNEEDALIIELLDRGCCALVNYHLTTEKTRHGYYPIYWGIPVKRVE